ncbi:MAG: hypothetical protein RMJ36_01275 [Candidatus Calescibacterium sp.]|nr:hypothetical protein [Candidatus Calescibacterium sp.]MDW8132272.1 hypothetical protein [Candidatus Calescibacterium sp.]
MWGMSSRGWVICLLTMFLILSNSFAINYKQNFVFEYGKAGFGKNLAPFENYFNSGSKFIENDLKLNERISNKKFFFFVDIKDVGFFNNYVVNSFNTYGSYNFTDFSSSSYFTNYKSFNFSNFDGFGNLNGYGNVKFEFNTVYNLKKNVYIDFKTSFYLDKDLNEISLNKLNQSVNSKFRVYIKF